MSQKIKQLDIAQCYFEIQTCLWQVALDTIKGYTRKGTFTSH